MNMNLQIKRKRSGQMDKFFIAKSEFITAEDILEKITKFRNKQQQFDLFAEQQEKEISGIRIMKLMAFKNAAELTSKWGKRSYTKAHDEGLFNLEKQLNHTAPEIMKLPDLRALNLMKDMKKGLADNLSLFSSQ